MYKNNFHFSSKFEGYSPLQASNLTGMKHAVGYYSYTKRRASLCPTTN